MNKFRHDCTNLIGIKNKTFLMAFVMLFSGFSCFANGPILDEEYFEVHIEDCNAMGEVCIDIPFADSPNYDFIVDGIPYAGIAEPCNADTIYTYGYADVPIPGPYELDSWYVNNNKYSGEFPDMFALLDSMNLWDSEGNWEINTMNQVIVGGNPNNTYSAMYINMLLLNSPTIIDANLGIQPNGTLFKFGKGLHEVVILEQLSGCLDTFEVAVSCAQNEEIYYDILLGDTETHCLDFSELPGFAQSVSNIHPVDPNPIASYSFVNGNSCVQIDAVNYGLDTACIVYCDQFNFCDTTFIYVNVSDGLMHTIDTSYVTVPVYTNSSFCFVDDFTGGAVSTIVGCGDMTETVTFSALDDTNCLDYTANTLGQDQMCVVFTDNAGNTHTEYLIVDIFPPVGEVIQETVFLGTTYNDCFDTSDLQGNIVSVTDICAANSNNSVNFGINNVSLCLEAESASLGVDTACIVLCDDQNICDTITYILSVIDNVQAPTLSNDLLSTTLNNQVDIDLCNNDQLFGLDITNVFILSGSSGSLGPENGSVAIDQGCSITYMPNEDYCGNDSFEYAVCNENGCDTATVNVIVDCGNSGSGDDLEIFNAFSPNFDGDNEYFTIQGINNYPGNVLKVYNRWGVRVHQSLEYKNDWRGTWEDGDLPDGTYFYTLDLTDGNIMSGYVQIQR